MSNHQAHNTLEGGPTFTRLENSGNHKGKEGVSLKGLSKASVKGKKDFARARLHKAWSPGIGEGSVSLFKLVPSEGANLSSADGDQRQRDVSNFQFNAKPRSRMGYRPRDASCEVSNDTNVGLGVDQLEAKEGLEVDDAIDSSEFSGREIARVETIGVQDKGDVHSGRVANCDLSVGQQVGHEACTIFPNGNEALGSFMSCGDDVGNRADEGMADADRMEFEGGGDANVV